VTECLSAGQQSYLRLWRGSFYPVTFDPEVRRYRPDLEFWQRVVKERQEHFIHEDLPEVSRQRIVRKCVCCGGTLSDSTTIKEVVFSKVDLTYFPYCLQPPVLPQIFAVMEEDH
jgi:hypothetical protein